MLSIIVPTLDEAAIIGLALQRLRPLLEQGNEVIVVDGGSTDATVRIAESLATRVIHGPRGRARQMNAGAEAASGDLLVFLHADTRLPVDAVRQIRQSMGGTRPGWGRFDVRFDPDRWYLRVIAAGMNCRSRWTGIATGDQAMFVDKALFEAVEGFPDIPLMEDVALSRTLRARARPKCLRSRVCTSARKWLDEGVVRTVLMMWRLRIEFALGGDPRRLHELYYRS